MAKKVVATLKSGKGKDFTKVIKDLPPLCIEMLILGRIDKHNLIIIVSLIVFSIFS